MGNRKDNARELDVQRAGLLLVAAHHAMMMAMSHELMNQQNSVQVNAQLIGVLARGDRAKSSELTSAADRISADSQRSVTSFALMQTLGQALVCELQGEKPTPFLVRQTLPDVLSALVGHRAERCALECDPSLRLTGSSLVGLGALIMTQLRAGSDPITLNFGDPLVSLTWKFADQATLAQFWAAIEEPCVNNCAISALQAWLKANGLPVQWEISEEQSRMQFQLG